MKLSHKTTPAGFNQPRPELNVYSNITCFYCYLLDDLLFPESLVLVLLPTEELDLVSRLPFCPDDLMPGDDCLEDLADTPLLWVSGLETALLETDAYDLRELTLLLPE